MKRFVTSLFLIIFFAGICSVPVCAETNLRNYKSINIAKGSFLKAISQRTISTSTVKVGDIEYFINPADVFIGTSNVIPKNSVYLGEVQEVLEAVEGVNAAMKIKISLPLLKLKVQQKNLSSLQDKAHILAERG